jgi:hypothetical protein
MIPYRRIIIIRHLFVSRIRRSLIWLGSAADKLVTTQNVYIRIETRI